MEYYLPKLWILYYTPVTYIVLYIKFTLIEKTKQNKTVILGDFIHNLVYD